MKRRVLFLSVLFVCISGIAISQKSVEFKTIKENTQKKDITTLLIAGVGTTPARIFLENLAEELGKDLKGRKVQSEYQYLGANLESASEELVNLLKDNKYKAILVINESDTSVADRRGGSNGYVALPTGSYTPAIPLLYSPLLKKRSKLYFEQEYLFRIFENGQATSTWDAMLNVYINLAKNSAYNNISEKVIKSLQANRFFW